MLALQARQQQGPLQPGQQPLHVPYRNSKLTLLPIGRSWREGIVRQDDHDHANLAEIHLMP